MNQSQTRGDVIERAGEVGRVLAEKVEHGVVLAEASRDVAALGPVAPVVAQRFLERADTSSVVLGLRTEQVVESLLVVAEHQLLCNPTLGVLQVAEALFVEVVRHPETGNDLLVGDESAALDRSEVAQLHLEAVAVTIR